MILLAAALFLLFGMAVGFGVGYLLYGRKADHGEGLSALVADARTQLLQLAEAQLGSKQGLIDQRLTTIQTEMTGKLEKVTTLVADIEKTRAASFATLTTQLGRNAEGLQTLQQTTADLKAALSNSRTRGQWGERMAEDVLKLAGLQPNIQYRKQPMLSSAEGGRPRPDFSFMMPENRVIHMDVKFPMDNYLAYLNAQAEPARATALKSFLSDVRARIRETSSRDYRNAANAKGETTLDYILIFIPNEQIYAFLLEHDPDLLHDAVGKKVIPCSPTTLLAVLSILHQTAQHALLNQKSAEVFDTLRNIRAQWEKFTDEMGKMGKKLAEAQNAFTELTGTRSKMLDRQFNKLENLPGADESAPTTLIGTVPSSDKTLN
ncbi:MAG TPA: DNA recombination protein RmuC [Alphaproteobacteria bacterium]|nr:DNA recombination protein RmuC [Alphaproteobacteria bacterium]